MEDTMCATIEVLYVVRRRKVKRLYRKPCFIRQGNRQKGLGQRQQRFVKNGLVLSIGIKELFEAEIAVGHGIGLGIQEDR
jgi:hypothetical protein